MRRVLLPTSAAYINSSANGCQADAYCVDGNSECPAPGPAPYGTPCRYVHALKPHISLVASGLQLYVDWQLTGSSGRAGLRAAI